MEASTYGVPVIGTNIGGIPDVIEDGKNGFLLQTQSIDELRSKIKLILKSRKLTKKMGDYGKRKMKKEFSPKECADRHVDAYKAAITFI